MTGRQNEEQGIPEAKFGLRKSRELVKKWILGTLKRNKIPLVDANFNVVTRVKKYKLNPSFALFKGGQNPKGTPFCIYAKIIVFARNTHFMDFQVILSKT